MTMATNVDYYFDEENNRILEVSYEEECKSDDEDEDSAGANNENRKRKRSIINWRFKEEFQSLAEAKEYLKGQYKEKAYKTKSYFGCKEGNQYKNKAYLYYQQHCEKVFVFINDRPHSHVGKRTGWGIKYNQLH